MKKLELERPYSYIVYLAIALTLAGIGITVWQASTHMPAVRLVTVAAGYVIVLYYALFGYKKPHGNLLRYVILGFGLLLVVSLATMGGTAGAVPEGGAGAPQGGPSEQANSFAVVLSPLLSGICALLAGYVSGRLNKFEQNKYLFTLILVLLIVKAFISAGNRPMMMTDLNDAILWFDINCAYFARYHMHKEAGLAV